MNYSQTIKPQRLNMDASRKYLPADSGFFLLNHDTQTIKGKGLPQPGNYPACDMDQPAGENYNIGRYKAERVNELYGWTWNSHGVHFINRINNEGECQIVYFDPCLELSIDPQHEIIQKRAFLHIEKSDCANRHGKYLMWVDGNREIPGYLDVEASIATDNFSTPYFTKCNFNPCDLISLCVPQPCGCVIAEWIPLPTEQIGWTNHVVDVGFKFMFKHEYYDGRMSEWSDRSTLYYQNSKGCFDNGAGFSRCLKIRIPVGNPMVTRIHIAFNKSEFDEAGNNIWYETEVVEKYQKFTSGTQYWYERGRAPLEGYADSDCSFDYIFCNDKQCNVVDPVEVSRVFDPIPRKAWGILPIKESVGLFNYELGNCPIDKNEVSKFHINIFDKDHPIIIPPPPDTCYVASTETPHRLLDMNGDRIIWCPANPVLAFFELQARSLDTIQGTSFTLTGPAEFKVDWGDGTVSSYVAGAHPIHTYSSSYTGIIKVETMNLSDITSLAIGPSFTNAILPTGGLGAIAMLTSELAKLPSLTSLYLGYDVYLDGIATDIPPNIVTVVIANTNLSGQISALPRPATYVDIEGLNTLDGPVTDLPPNIVFLILFGNNTLTGNVSGIPTSLTTLYLEGNNSVSGNVTGLPPNLTQLEVKGTNTLTGDVNNIPKSIYYVLNITGNNTLSGDIANLPPSLQGVSLDGFNTVTGDIASLPSVMIFIQLLGNNTVFGNLANIPLVATYINIVSTTASVNAYTAGRAWSSTMEYINLIPGASGFASSAVDNILIDLAASATTWINYMAVNILGASGARTAASDAAVATLVSRSVVIMTI